MAAKSKMATDVEVSRQVISTSPLNPSPVSYLYLTTTHQVTDPPHHRGLSYPRAVSCHGNWSVVTVSCHGD